MILDCSIRDIENQCNLNQRFEQFKNGILGDNPLHSVHRIKPVQLWLHRFRGNLPPHLQNIYKQRHGESENKKRCHDFEHLYIHR